VRFFLLTGLVRCCECGGAMAGQTNVRIAKDGSRIETRFYRDRTILDDGGICGKMISADQLETQVEAEIKRIVLPQTWKERIVALAQSSPQFNVMERKRRELRSQLSRLQGLYVKGINDKRRIRAESETDQPTNRRDRIASFAKWQSGDADVG
jgi:hypothetical protein